MTNLEKMTVEKICEQIQNLGDLKKQMERKNLRIQSPSLSEKIGRLNKEVMDLITELNSRV